MINAKRFMLIYIFAAAMALAGCTELLVQDSGGADISGAEVSAVSYRYEQKPEVRQATPEEAEKYPQLTNLPSLYIDMDIIPWENMSRSRYVPGVYTMVYGGEGIYNEPLTIKGRGKYSWSNPKKPYVFKSAREIGLLGMKSASKWVIVGEYVDKTMLRAYMTFWLSAETGADYTPDSRFVDLYLNGEYNGLYLMTEAIQIHENRVNIDRNTEAIFEIEATYRCEGHDWCINMIGGNHHINYKRPGIKEYFSHDAKTGNLEKFKDFFVEMQASLSQGYGEYSKYIDVESFVNWYIVNEITKNFDSAFTASCYCYFKNGKIYMGPVWDYHTAYGNQDIGPPVNKLNPAGYHVSSSPWFSILTADEDFRRLLHGKWTQMADDGIFDAFLTHIREMSEYISEAADKNFEKWRGALRETGLRGRSSSKFTYAEEIEYFINWATARIEWLDGEWYAK